MTEQFANLIIVVGISILLTFFWAVSVVFAVWDIRRRNLAGISAAAWLMLVVLAPFVGLGVYLFFRVLDKLSSRRAGTIHPTGKRETALKQPPEKQRPMATIVAADLMKETIAAQPAYPPPETGQQPKPVRYGLAVASGPDQGRVFGLDRLPALIGRSSEAAIRLDKDPGVSRRHAEIYARNDRLWIRDLKSTHGTWVNGLRVEADHGLKTGDRVQVGTTVLLLKAIEG